jgi:cytochrome c biogenesis protein CcmG, thiol:disulfide interchange protein DsbE
MKNWMKLALLAVAAIVVTQVLVQKSAPPMPADGVAAPTLALPDLAGRPVDLAGLKGKVVAVNFWASWCGPCRGELPELAQVWRANRNKCFELLGVAEESAREDVLAAAREIPYPVLVDADAHLLDTWDVPSYPHTFVVDVAGRVRHVFRGTVGRDELEAVIRPLLPSSCPST